ncbi:MAG: hypothetical protein WBN24_08510, partial [Acidimicrobiia bacterium]
LSWSIRGSVSAWELRWVAAEGEECKSDEGSALRNLNAIRVSERALVSELDPSRVGLTKHQGVIAPLGESV